MAQLQVSIGHAKGFDLIQDQQWDDSEKGLQSLSIRLNESFESIHCLKLKIVKGHGPFVSIHRLQLTGKPMP